VRKSYLFCSSVLGLSLITLSGCAAKPTVADLMKGHATELQSQVDFKNELASNWEKGAKLVSTGEERVEDAKKRKESAERELEKAQDDIERGGREIAEGQELMQKSEKQYRESFPELMIKSLK
jgi:predicted  nucleic acid-binding Zn-ribbon protein